MRAETRTGWAGITAPKFLDNIALVHIKSIRNVTFFDCSNVRKDYMVEKEAIPQQPVISIRISEALRLRLETLKENHLPQERPKCLDIGGRKTAS